MLKWSIGANVPRLDITTDSYIYEVTSKTDYVSGKLKVSGRGLFEDLDDITVLLRAAATLHGAGLKRPIA